MFQDVDDTPRVMGLLRGIGTRTARAGIFSPAKADQAEKLGYQEFGTVDIPQRQTVAPAFDQGVDGYVSAVADGVGAVLDGRLAPGDASDQTAAQMAADIRARIESNTPPALADSTLASRRRRGNTSVATLVDTGAMLGAIEHDVIAGEGSDDG